MPDPDTISADYTLRPSELVATLKVHLKVRFAWIAQASVLPLQKLDAIRRFECRNLFLRRHNWVQPELSRTFRLQPHAAATRHRPPLNAKAAEPGRRSLPSRSHFRATTLAPLGLPLHGRS